ncbi:ATP-binding protein [Ekhidna sp.]
MAASPEKSLKIKIWLILSIAAVIAAGAILWTTHKFDQLSGSIYQLSQPNEKVALINSTFQDFISAENYIQNYIITGNISAARNYQGLIDKTRLGIDQLATLNRNDSAQLKRIDSLDVILQKKIDYLNKFFVLKRQRQSIAFTTLAREQIEASTTDTSVLEQKVYSKTDISGSLKPIEKKHIINREDTSKGFWSSVKRLFGNSYIVDTVTKVEYDYYTFERTSHDTATIKSYSPDSVLQQVKKILTETEGKEVQFLQNLTRQELAMIEQDQIFMKQIRSIITNLDKSEREAANARRKSAFILATDSTRVIVIIGVVSLLIGSILFIFITKDITKASYLRKQLEIAKSKAEKLANIKGSFLSNMSHEIRTPLNSILGFTKILENTSLSGSQQKYMHAVSGSSGYLMELVNDILDYSKIESGKLHINKTPFSTEKLKNDIKKMFLLNAEEKGLKLKLTESNELPQWLLGDAFRVKQIISNLLSNAVKFTSSGHITVTFDGHWYKEKFYFSVIVSDTGIGIASEKLSAIFDVFSQEENDTADRFGGTGLGLAICYRLTKAMKGSIHAESNKGKGSSFKVVIPMVKVDERSLPEVLPSEEIGELNLPNAYIVLVEDDHWNALLLKTILTRRKAQVKVFHNPLDALGFLQKNEKQVDLLFTDLKMPGMRGEDLVKSCRKNGFDKPIVAITAHIQKEQKNEVLSMDIQAICSKPYEEEEIDLVLADLLPDKAVKESVSSKEKGEQNVSNIDLSDLKKFAGDNPALLKELLAELKTNNQKQLESYKYLLDQEKWLELAELTHRMIPTYEHTKQHHISELLRSIELYVEISNFDRAKELANEAILELEKAIRKFEEINDQYHIS